MAEGTKIRKSIPAIRNNVWCNRCGQPGHYPNECPHVPPRRVQFVDAEGSVFFMEAEYEEEGEDQVPVY